MPLRFNTFLTLEEADSIEPTDVVLLRHQDGRAARGRTPYELWRDDTPGWDWCQSRQSPRNRVKLARAPFWASFVVTPQGETMFAGLYLAAYVGLNETDEAWPHADGIDLAGTADVYDLVLDTRLSEFVGKLMIEWGDGTRAWIQRAENQNKVVSELRKVFKEPDFPGFLGFMLPLSQVASKPIGWAQTLKASRGIYLLTCPRTREQYVGSATGADGFIGRWFQYAATGHGGNVELKSREPADYQVSILEVAGTAATKDQILTMEALWKAKLQSREMGLNRN